MGTKFRSKILKKEKLKSQVVLCTKTDMYIRLYWVDGVPINPKCPLCGKYAPIGDLESHIPYDLVKDDDA